MKVNIVNEKDNPFLKRKELAVEIDHEKESTPTKAGLQQLVAKQLNKDVTSVDIRNIFSYEGMAKAKSKIFVWEEKKVDDLSKKVVKKEEKKEEVKEQEKEERKEVKAKPKSEEVKEETKDEEAPKEEEKEEEKPEGGKGKKEASKKEPAKEGGKKK